MRKGRMLTGVAGGVLVAAAALALPGALGATPSRNATPARHVAPPVSMLGFTPVAGDPRLAAMFARGGLDTGSFRFTPAETRAISPKVTVAVRARSSRAVDPARGVAIATADQGTTLAPIAYNMGVALSWKSLAVAGEVGRVDMASRPGSREAADVAVSYSLNRFTGRVKAAADRPLANAPQLVEAAPSYSLDVGGSYKLTRNLDVTAGVRYRSDRERLSRLEADRRDSQAVYLGTAFRF